MPHSHNSIAKPYRCRTAVEEKVSPHLLPPPRIDFVRFSFANCR